jgi:hypothetical protein
VSESRLVAEIKRAVRDKYPRAVFYKLHDRTTRGLPDLLIVCPNDCGQACHLFVETKSRRGRVSPIQQAQHDRLRAALATVLVVRDAATVLDWLETIGGCVP